MIEHTTTGSIFNKLGFDDAEAENSMYLKHNVGA